jgi:hypothetical protein
MIWFCCKNSSYYKLKCCDNDTGKNRCVKKINLQIYEITYNHKIHNTIHAVLGVDVIGSRVTDHDREGHVL